MASLGTDSDFEIVRSFLGSGCVTGLDIQKEVQRKTMGMCSVVDEGV